MAACELCIRLREDNEDTKNTKENNCWRGDITCWVGDKITYTIRIANNATEKISVKIIEFLPRGPTIPYVQPITHINWYMRGNVLIYNGKLDLGCVSHVTITVKFEIPGEYILFPLVLVEKHNKTYKCIREPIKINVKPLPLPVYVVENIFKNIVCKIVSPSKYHYIELEIIKSFTDKLTSVLKGEKINQLVSEF